MCDNNKTISLKDCTELLIDDIMNDSTTSIEYKKKEIKELFDAFTKELTEDLANVSTSLEV